FDVDLMPETLKRTNLAMLKVGDKINLEPSLRLNDELGGHFVLGHIDGIGLVKSIKNNELWITAPAELRKFIAFKGCIAVNGVSLTVSSARGKVFKVSLIPYTLRHTNLGALQPGAKVNLEIDMVARYLEKISHG
ncbi:riboflavin synthase, partial [Candidatus Peregrinibacteria bacterium]|nr:riboflavin synthase [Candidatus Peregrinibacteria bacterium]